MSHGRHNVVLLTFFVLTALNASAQKRLSGYYKDIFIDGGMYLTSRGDLPAARALGLETERFVSAKTDRLTDADSLIQLGLLVGSSIDENGILLYPDGQPRFRMVYVNGGKGPGLHGRSIGEKGRENFRAFVSGGGSYVGNCAGAYLAATGMYRFQRDRIVRSPNFFRLWPGTCWPTMIWKSYTALDVPRRSPLQQYDRSGMISHIDTVYQSGGCYTYPEDMPAGTEVLATYNTEGRDLKKDIHGYPAIWAYRPSEGSGRVIMSGPHMEGKSTAGGLALMKSLLQYALDGNPAPSPKTALSIGQTRSMTAAASAGKPEFARIGDLQYHHFTINVPAKTERLTVELEPVKGWEDFDLWVFATPGKLAYNDNARWADVSAGVRKKLAIDTPDAGKLYVSVYCATTVDAVRGKYGESYVGRTDVLNGVPYVIKIY